MNILQAFQRIAQRSINPDLFLAGYALVAVTGIVLLIAVLWKFLEHVRHPQPLKSARSHFFSTYGMTVVVLLLFPFWVNSVGQVALDTASQYIFFGVGALMLVFGFVLHLWAKWSIRLMWSDGIEIKQTHTLVTTGAYAWARHPMYAGLLMWCWGGSVLMFNWIAFAITCLVILPLMIVRAKAEEKMLLQVHPDYLLYQQNVRMFTPTLRGRVALVVKILGIGVLGYYVWTTWTAWAGWTAPMVIFLVFIHLFLGYSLLPEKVAFSYRSKSGMMLVFWGLSLLWHPFHYMMYVILAMFIYGLAFNCPCMIVYNKYQRCPCFSLFAAVCKRRER